MGGLELWVFPWAGSGNADGSATPSSCQGGRLLADGAEPGLPERHWGDYPP